MKKKKYAIIMISILFMALCVYADSDNPNCYDIFGSGIMKVIKDNILAPLRVIAPILLLIFTSMDFAKNVFKNNGASDKNGGLKEAFQRFLKRAVATLLVFFAQNIISFILGLVGLGGNCLEDDIELGDVKITCSDILYNGQEQRIATCDNGEFCDQDGNITNSEVLQTGVAEDDTNYNVHCRGYVSGEITSKSCTIKKNLSLRKFEQCYCKSSIERCQFTKDPTEGYEAQRLIQGEAACIEYNRNKMMGCFYSALSVRGRYEWSNSGNAANMQYHPEIRTKEECDAKNIIIIEVEKPTIEQLCANPTYTGEEQLITVETEHEGYTLNTEDITKKEAGSYPIKISLNENYRWKNGNKDDITLYCPIRKKVLNVTTTDQSSTRYPLNADNECNAEELIPGHTIECKNTGSLTSPQTETRKIISQVIIRDAGEVVTSNYDIKLHHGKLIVSQEQAVITCLNETYDGSPKTIATCEGGTIQNATQTYYRNGGYTITCNGDADHRNAISKQCNIGKRSITVKASDEGPFEYDGTVKRANNECTATNLVSGDTVACTGNGGSRTDAGTSRKEVGTVSIKHGSTDVTSNYMITAKISGTLTVSKRDIVVTAASKTKVYDGLPLTLSDTDANNCTATNLISEHIVTCKKNRGSQTDVGTSNSTAGDVIIKEGTKNVSHNYRVIRKNQGTLEVVKRELTVIAANQSQVYTGLPIDVSNTCSITDGTLVGNDELTCTCSGSQTAIGSSDKNIETVTISNSLRTPPDVTSNYKITKLNGTLTVTEKGKASKPTQASYCKTLTYNGREQELTKNAEVGYSFSNNIRTNAGSQRVTAVLNPGYLWSDNSTDSISFECSISKATIYVKPNNTTTISGQIPEMSYSVINNVTSESVTLSGTPQYKVFRTLDGQFVDLTTNVFTLQNSAQTETRQVYILGGLTSNNNNYEVRYYSRANQEAREYYGNITITAAIIPDDPPVNFQNISYNLGYVNEFKYKKMDSWTSYASWNRFGFIIKNPRISSNGSNFNTNRVYFCLEEGNNKCSNDLNAIVSNGIYKVATNTGRTSHDTMFLNYYNWIPRGHNTDNTHYFESGTWYYNKVPELDNVGFSLITPTANRSEATHVKNNNFYRMINGKMKFILLKVENNNCNGSNCKVTENTCILEKNTQNITSSNYEGGSYTCS